MFKVFVYGTLKPNECNYPDYCQGKVTEEIRVFTKGKLYHLPNLGYPAMVEGEDFVEGFLLTFSDDHCLADLDSLEDYEEGRNNQFNVYYRRLITVVNNKKKPIDKAWAYFMTFEKVNALNGVLVQSGWWKSIDNG